MIARSYPKGHFSNLKHQSLTLLLLFLHYIWYTFCWSVFTSDINFAGHHLFDQAHKGRIYAFFRNPVDRSVSKVSWGGGGGGGRPRSSYTRPKTITSLHVSDNAFFAQCAHQQDGKLCRNDVASRMTSNPPREPETRHWIFCLPNLISHTSCFVFHDSSFIYKRRHGR